MTQASRSNLDAARNQLREQYGSEYARFGGQQAMADSWLDSVFVLELAADLHEKEEMFISDFVADRTLLASTGLMAFASFFDESYRKHDYDYGRNVAQEKLKQYHRTANSIFCNLHWTPKQIDPIDPQLNGIQMAQIDKAKRKKVRDQISSAANQLLKELNVPGVVREPLMFFIVDGKIKKLLALE